MNFAHIKLAGYSANSQNEELRGLSFFPLATV